MIAFGDSCIRRWQVGDRVADAGSMNLSLGLVLPELKSQTVSDSEEIRSQRAKYAKRHSGKMSISFCDGHIEQGKPQAFFDSRSESVLRRWNKDNQPHKDLLPN